MRNQIIGVSFLLLVVGCDDSSSSNKCGGGPVTGVADTHCVGMPVVTVVPAACTPAPSPSPAPDGGVDTGPDYGDTMYNTSGKDDDCKYAVSYTATAPLCENTPMTFTLTANKIADGSAVTCDPKNMRAEVFLTQDHISPTIATVASPTPGTYVFSNVQFNASGTWTVRFHICENCDDSAISPHGHAAFYVNVP